MKVVPSGAVTLYDMEPVTDDFLEQVLDGLSRTPKWLPCKFFYDLEGAALFEEITKLEEYYPTRLELAIMADMADLMAEHVGEGVRLVEFGSGSSQKTRLLLDALRAPASYVPIDISRDHLVQSARQIQADYPDLLVQPLCADFTEPFELPPEEQPSRSTVAYFPGSTLGNFEEADARKFLSMVAERLGPGGALLLGIDRYPARHHGLGDQKPKTIDDLHWAYNDARGVTARFNLNLLIRMKRELGAEFDFAAFRHEAVFDAVHNRMEMRLLTEREQVLRVGGQEFPLRRGEWIVTEHSHKYDAAAIERICAPAGFATASAQVYSEDDGWFTVCLLRVAD